MKKVLLMGLLAAACTFSAKSQTKGTNVLGLSFGTGDSKSNASSENGQAWESEGRSISSLVHYGHFIKDNLLLGAYVGYSHAKSSYSYDDFSSNSSTSRMWSAGGNLTRYYPLVKKLYATVGANMGYNYIKSEESKINDYNVGASGGVSYFVNKHWSLETVLLSAGGSYQKQVSQNNQNSQHGETVRKSFGISTRGTITNLGFSINFLF